MLNILSTLFFILLVQGHVMCESELFPVSMFGDATERKAEFSSDNNDTESPMRKSAIASPVSTRQLKLDPDIIWIQEEIVGSYGFKKDPEIDEWKQQPSFENDLGTAKFRKVALKALKFFKINSDWESSKTKKSCSNLLYMTAARYLLVTHILYEQSGKELIACKEVAEYGKMKRFVIPDSGVCFPKPYGSATCKSDYDVGLIGKDAGILTKKFNNYFQTTFGKPSELVFDTNVYAFTLEFSMPFIFHGLPIRFADLITQKEQSVNFKMQELASSYYKVFKYNEGFFLTMANKAKRAMKKTFKEQLNYWLSEFNKLNNQHGMRLVKGNSLKDFRKSHNEQYQTRVAEMSKNGGYKAENLGILAEALIYAAEAYHTRGAIRHVVGGMQLKSIGGQNNNALSTHDLWVSMIENWGESNKEYNHCSQDPLTKCLLKMSKYLLRMFNAMRLLRSRLPIIKRFFLLNFKTPNDPESTAGEWLRYKKEGKTEIPESKNSMIKSFLGNFKCKIRGKTTDFRNTPLSPECLGKIHDAVNAYNVKLAAALATDLTIKKKETFQK